MSNEEKTENAEALNEEQAEATTEDTATAEGADTEQKEEEEAPAEVSVEDQLKAANDKYLRLYSEFDNYRRRTQREKIDLIKNAGADVIKDLLTILDDFDRAALANKDSEDHEALKEGFALIQQKLIGQMERKGLKAMDSIGKPFDVDHHEAITEIPAPSDDLKGKVVDAVEKGYFLNDRVLRYAKVVVGK